MQNESVQPLVAQGGESSDHRDSMNGGPYSAVSLRAIPHARDPETETSRLYVTEIESHVLML